MTTPTVRTPTLRRVARADGDLVVADYPGAEPAVVIMHGFIDRRTINKPLAEHLEGRRVLLFDFLGYGESDKPAGHPYDAASFEDDLDAVVSELTDKPIVLVGHDASGPTAINWATRNPERTEHLVLLNTYYHQTPSLRFPEIIALFADPATRPLTTELAADQVFLLLALLWQGAEFSKLESSARGRSTARWFAPFPFRELRTFIGFSPTNLGVGLRLLRAMAKWRFAPSAEQMGWVEEFGHTPRTTKAFLGWVGDLHPNVVSNTARVDALQSFDRPVTVAFGRHDPYLTPGLAHEIAGLFLTSSVQLLDAGHWPQLELPKLLAEIVRPQEDPNLVR